MSKRVFLSMLLMVLAGVALSTIAAEKANSQMAEVTTENPIQVNKADGAISFLAAVNGKYFLNPTRHAAVYALGKFGDKSVFISYASPKAFNDALAEIGAKAGENMTMENKEKTTVQGDLLDVTVTWKGAPKSYSLDDVIKDSNGKPIAIRYGGNLPLSLEKNTGCLICLDSCPVGICSNSTYSYGAVEARNEVTFVGNKDILPPDGSLVVITVKKKT